MWGAQDSGSTVETCGMKMEGLALDEEDPWDLDYESDFDELEDSDSEVNADVEETEEDEDVEMYMG